MISIQQKHSQKIKEGRTLSNSFYVASITMITKPNTLQEKKATNQYPS